MNQPIVQVSDPVPTDDVDHIIRRAEDLTRMMQGASVSRARAVEQMLTLVDDLTEQNDELRTSLQQARDIAEETQRALDESRQDGDDSRQQVAIAMEEVARAQERAMEVQVEKEQVLEAHRRLMNSFTALLEDLGPHLRDILDVDRRIEMARSRALSRARYEPQHDGQNDIHGDEGDDHDQGNPPEQPNNGYAGPGDYRNGSHDAAAERVPARTSPLHSVVSDLNQKVRRAITGLESASREQFGMRMLTTAGHDAGY